MFQDSLLTSIGIPVALWLPAHLMINLGVGWLIIGRMRTIPGRTAGGLALFSIFCILSHTICFHFGYAWVIGLSQVASIGILVAILRQDVVVITGNYKITCIIIFCLQILISLAILLYYSTTLLSQFTFN